MFRKILGVAALMAIALTVPASAGMIGDRSQPDIAGFGQANNSRVSSTPVLMIDYDGDVLPAANQQQDLGESTRSFRNVFAGSLILGSGTFNYSDFYFNLSSGSLNGLSKVQGFSVSTGTLITGGSTYLDVNINQSSGAGRNITIFIASSPVNLIPPPVGAGIGTTTLIGMCTFYGFDSKGNFVSEGISFSTASQIGRSTDTGAGLCQTQDCNANKGMGIGNVAFAYISSFTINVSSITAAFGLMTTSPTFVIGWGQKIGLTNNLENVGDVYKVLEGGGDVSVLSQNPAIAFDATYDTVVFGTLPNSLQNKQVWYKIRRTR